MLLSSTEEAAGDAAVVALVDTLCYVAVGDENRKISCVVVVVVVVVVGFVLLAELVDATKGSLWLFHIGVGTAFAWVVGRHQMQKGTRSSKRMMMMEGTC